MPVSPLKSCPRFPCPNKRARGARYCEDHDAAEKALIDKTRPNSYRRGYTGTWAKYRKAYLAEHPLCVEPGCNRAAAHVDHITPHKGKDDPLFWEPSNHQGLCHSDHSRKTARQDGRWSPRRR